MIFDDRRCELGEGAFWHPERQQVFWFDILNAKLMAEGGQVWDLPEMASAAACVSRDVLLISGERRVFLYALDTQAITPLCQPPQGATVTRSNDGKADRQGGFWISTMAKEGDRTGIGAIHRLYGGELRQLYPAISIPNAICFSPDGSLGYFADTMEQTVWQVALDAQGWPAGEPRVYLDFKGTDIDPDGATIDAEGNFWNAQWGLGRVACYSPAGAFLREVTVDAPNTSCPAFGGANMDTLYVTTAQEGMTPAERAAHPHAGKVFAFEGVAKGLPDRMVQP